MGCGYGINVVQVAGIVGNGLTLNEQSFKQLFIKKRKICWPEYWYS